MPTSRSPQRSGTRGSHRASPIKIVKRLYPVTYIHVTTTYPSGLVEVDQCQLSGNDCTPQQACDLWSVNCDDLLRIDSLAYGGNGVARLDGFVVFVRARAAGRHGARARHEGAAPPCRGDHDRGASSRARSASRRRARTTRRAAAAASRISPTRRSSRRSTRGSRTRCAGSPGSPSRRSSRSSRAEEVFGYRNKMEYSFAPGTDGPELGLHRAGRWDEVLGIERCWLTTDLGNRDPQHDARLGARGAAAGLRPGQRRRATSGISSSARAGTPARRSSSSSRTSASASTASG